MLQSWSNVLLKHAEYTIVTNGGLAAYVEQQGGRALIIPDPLPNFELSEVMVQNTVNQTGIKKVLFICSWSEDEPYLEVLKAAKLIDKNIQVTVTGNWRKVFNELPNELPDNVELTGFVSEVEFEELLFECDIVMDLTTRENCLVCGAYEAMAAKKPVVLSDTTALREYFHKGAVFSGNHSVALAKSITDTLSDIESLNQQVQIFSIELREHWSGLLREAELQLVKLSR